MAVNNYNSVTGAPEFTDGGAPDIAVDPTAVGAYAADVGNRIVRANLAALNAYAFKRAGLEGVALDTGAAYMHDGTGWTAQSPRIGMRRSTQTGAISNTVYTDLSSSSFWVEEYRTKIAAYSGGITIPATGVYEVSYTISAIQGILAGITVNKSTGIAVGDLQLVATSTTVQGVATASTSGKLALNAGDVLRLFSIAGAAGATWRTEAGLSSFQVEWS